MKNIKFDLKTGKVKKDEFLKPQKPFMSKADVKAERKLHGRNPLLW